VIFGRLHQYFVVNRSVNSALNKFLTQVAPPSDKITNSVFHLQDHAKPLYSNVHFCRKFCSSFTKFWHNSSMWYSEHVR